MNRKGQLQINKKTPNKTMGRVLMKAENTGNLNLNGTGSFGIVTVFNKGVPKNLFIPSFQSSHEDLRSERLYDGQRVLPGGEIGRSALADEKYRSGIYNTGNINISGDNSIAVGLLQEIQEVAQTISEKAGHDKANLLWGYIMEPELEGTISVSLVATDFEEEFLTTDIQVSKTIRFAPSEEKVKAESKTEQVDKENNYQNEENNYEEEKMEDVNDFVLPPFFEE